MKRLEHICHLLLSVCVCLSAVLIVIDGHPLRHFSSLYVPDDNNYNINYDEPILSAANKPVLVIEKKFINDKSTANDQAASLSDASVLLHLKKKNSEIISVLMGLRRAMSDRYGECLHCTP